MHWVDDGFVLGARRHGETSAVVTLLTRDHGRHAGLVRGGAGRKARAVLQTGNLVAANWRARLAEHLGTLTCEPLRAYAAEVMGERLPLLALGAAAALIDKALPERAPHPEVFADLAVLVEGLTRSGWEAGYVRFELALLAALGFGLDLGSCAVTGGTDGLAYVSPRTGRAVSAAAAEPYRERLLALPAFLLDPTATASRRDIVSGLDLSGHFFARHVFAAPLRLPAVRTELVDALR
jgi:DNA repair protein RecO (recombination protein O)